MKINITLDNNEDSMIGISEDSVIDILGDSMKDILKLAYRFKRNELLSQDWNISKDKNDIDMIYYKNIPVDEIIYATGEIILSGGTFLDWSAEEEKEIIYKLLNDNDFRKNFYEEYLLVNENYSQLNRYLYLKEVLP